MIVFKEIIKEPSHRMVLNLIRQQRQVSGAELSRITGLQPSTLVYIIRTLSGLGFIEKDGFGESTERGGKKPVLWKVNPHKANIAGMEILPKQFRLRITSLNDDLVTEQVAERTHHLSPEQLLFDGVKFFKTAIRKSKLTKENILGLGVAVPGLVDMETGRILFSRSLNVEDFSLGDQLENALNIPVLVSNDANAGALAIQWYTNTIYDAWYNKVF